MNTHLSTRKSQRRLIPTETLTLNFVLKLPDGAIERGKHLLCEVMILQNGNLSVHLFIRCWKILNKHIYIKKSD